MARSTSQSQLRVFSICPRILIGIYFSSIIKQIIPETLGIPKLYIFPTRNPAIVRSPSEYAEMADIQPNDAANLSKERKRTRVQLSCTACRSRKYVDQCLYCRNAVLIKISRLKCCRTHPCTNCLKRGEAHSCTFVGRGPRGRSSHGRSSPTHVQDRLQHLENLIMSFAQRKQQEEPQPQIGSSPSSGTPPSLLSREQSAMLTTASPPKPEGSEPENEGSPPGGAGKLLVKDTGTSYIDSAHWKAILEEVGVSVAIFTRVLCANRLLDKRVQGVIRR